MDDLKKMAIRDIPVGVLSSGTGTWDYSHLLSAEQRDRDLRLLVSHNPQLNILKAAVHRGDTGEVGAVHANLLSDKRMTPHALLALPGTMRGQGLGRAMYEALYAHAYKKHGVKVVDGGYHSAGARRVHESLARRHGLKYNPEPGFSNEPGEGVRGGPYEYRLSGRPMAKAEPRKTYGIDWRKPKGYLPEYDLQRAPNDYQTLLHQHAQDHRIADHWRDVPKLYRVKAHPLQPLYDEVKSWTLDDRVSDTPSYIDDLADAIRSGYPLPPVVVGHLGAKKWGVVDGRHRILAARRAGLTHVPVIDLDEHPAWAHVSRPPLKKTEGETCPKCGKKDVVVRVIGEPVFECKDCKHHWEVPFEGSLENSDIGSKLPDGTTVDKTMVKGDDEREYYAPAPTAMMRSPAFRHVKTKQVVESPLFHDESHLPAGEYGQGLWEDGFVDHAGKFYNRRDAAIAVGAHHHDVTGSEPWLESQDYVEGHDMGLYKAERSPSWVKHPKLPARIRRIFDAVRANLTPDLLKPEYQGHPNPFHGHCYVATEALWFLLNGKQTGWERMHLATSQGPHWFLQHKKTGTVLDPTAEQFDERPDYDAARAKGFSVGPPDYDAEKPSKRAQILIDRVQPELVKTEDDDFQELAKTVGYITFPKLGVHTAHEPMTYPKGEGFQKRGKKGRDIFSARFQLVHDPAIGGAEQGVSKPNPDVRRRGADVHEVVKDRGFGAWSASRSEAHPTPGPERTATGFVMGGKVHGLVGTRAHEAQHSVFGQLAQRYGDETREKAIERLIQGLPPLGIEAGRRLMQVSGYSLGLDPEEFITSHQQFLTDERSRKSILKALNLPVEAHRNFFKLIRQNFEHMRQAAATMTPRKLGVPKLPSRKLRKNEVPLAKAIAAIPQGRVLAHNPVTHESLHEYSHVLPPAAQQEGYRIRLHHTPRVNGIVARVYDPAGQYAGSLSTYHNIEQGEPVLGIDTAHVKAPHRGKGLGMALYEANYVHARNVLGIRRVVGDAHTAEADKVHQRLAAKHGLLYQPEWRQEQAAGPYEYLLKDEFQPQEAGDKAHEFVKSEDWTPEDFEAQFQVLEKAARAAPGQLGLPGIGEDVPESPEREVARQARESAERDRLMKQPFFVLPRHVWGATWHERAEKGKLYSEEVDDFLRRVTDHTGMAPVPVRGSNGEVEVRDGERVMAPTWDEAATQERPALTEANIDHFLDSYWDRMPSEQRAQLFRSKHGDVSDWLHKNHNRLNDEEFRHVAPNLTSAHVWHDDHGLSDSRLGMLLDAAKKSPRPEGKPPVSEYRYGVRQDDDENDPWFPWNEEWDRISDLLRYTPMSKETAARFLDEFPRDHRQYWNTATNVAPNLDDEQLSKLLEHRRSTETQEGWETDRHGMWSRAVGLAVGAHARSPELQRRAYDFLMERTQHASAGEMVRNNKHLSPELAKYIVSQNGPHSVLKALLRNKNLHPDVLPELAKTGTKGRGYYNRDDAVQIRTAVAEHPLASEELVRDLAENDKRSAVRKAAVKALAWHDPSSEHPEHVDVRFNTNKLRQVRDYIEAQGKESMPPKELPPGDWKAVRDEKGNVSTKKIDEYIESLPATKYGVSEGIWKGMQRHSRDHSYVFQLNLSTDQVRKLKEAGAFETFRKMHEASHRSNHPVGHAGLGWVRWTGDEKGIHIDEVQSDLGQSFVKQAANQARARGQDADEAAAAAEREYPEEHYQKIRDIVFGGKHPSEVLQEAFHQWLRQEKKPNHTGYNPRTGTTFRYGGRKSYIGTPIHIWTPESKATISLRYGGGDKKLPGHFYVGYRDVPQKRMGMKPAKYGELPTQTSRKHEGKDTWSDVLRKSEWERPPGGYVNLGVVEG